MIGVVLVVVVVDNGIFKSAYLPVSIMVFPSRAVLSFTVRISKQHILVLAL